MNDRKDLLIGITIAALLIIAMLMYVFWITPEVAKATNQQDDGRTYFTIDQASLNNTTSGYNGDGLGTPFNYDGTGFLRIEVPDFVTLSSTYTDDGLWYELAWTNGGGGGISSVWVSEPIDGDGTVGDPLDLLIKTGGAITDSGTGISVVPGEIDVTQTLNYVADLWSRDVVKSEVSPATAGDHIASTGHITAGTYVDANTYVQGHGGLYAGDNATLGLIRLYDATANYLTLDVPAMASDYTLTFPGAVPAGNGYALIMDTSGNVTTTTITGISGYQAAPGSVTEIPYNNGSSWFAAEAGFTYTAATNTFVAETIQASAVLRVVNGAITGSIYGNTAWQQDYNDSTGAFGITLNGNAGEIKAETSVTAGDTDSEGAFFSNDGDGESFKFFASAVTDTATCDFSSLEDGTAGQALVIGSNAGNAPVLGVTYNFAGTIDGYASMSGAAFNPPVTGYVIDYLGTNGDAATLRERPFSGTDGSVVPACTITRISYTIADLSDATSVCSITLHPYDDGAAIDAACVTASIAEGSAIVGQTVFTPGTYTVAVGSVLAIYMTVTGDPENDAELSDLRVEVEYMFVR